MMFKKKHFAPELVKSAKLKKFQGFLITYPIITHPF